MKQLQSASLLWVTRGALHTLDGMIQDTLRSVILGADVDTRRPYVFDYCPRRAQALNRWVSDEVFTETSSVELARTNTPWSLIHLL